MNPCDARGLVKLNADRTVETINLVLGHTVAVTVAATVRDATPLGKGCACRGKERDREREGAGDVQRIAQSCPVAG